MCRVSNMKASVSPRNFGSSFAALAESNVCASGPCPDMQLCRLPPPGAKPSALASYTPRISPMYSFITLRWKYRGRKITKSQLAVPGVSDGDVSTVKIEGSGWSNETVLMTLNFERSYLYGA